MSGRGTTRVYTATLLLHADINSNILIAHTQSGPSHIMFAESVVSKTWSLKAIVISALVCHSYLGAVSFRDTGIDK